MNATRELTDRIDDLDRMIQDALARTGRMSMQRLSISVDDRNVRLEGRVETYYEKLIAQNHVWEVDGIESVDNRIEVM